MNAKQWMLVLTFIGGLVGGAGAQQAPVPAAPAKETPKQEAKATAAAETPAALPPGRATLGVHFLDQDVETFGDLILPVYTIENGLLFVNPRGSINDSDGQECNIGVGYRHLFPEKGFIVGGNAYYDLRDTELDNTFNQFGFGVEFLSKWVDARANYYLPEDETKAADQYLQRKDTVREITQTWRTPEAEGNLIQQYGWTADSTYEVTSLQHYRVYEQALEGFDAEIGALLPIPVVQEFMDVKAFVGWYDFDANYGDDVQGVKARMEIRALPSLLLDATWLEDKELYGSRYSVGARASVPFDLANLSKGKNPFAGALAGFGLSRDKAPLSARLTEMVIRDLHVRTDASDPEEVVADRRQLDKKLVSRVKKGKYHLVATDVTFVDDDNRSGNEDGSWEHPYRTIETGIANKKSGMVYVRDAAEQYYENVIMTEGLVLWGSGCLIPGAGGKSFGSGIYPVVNGQNLAPAITLASGTELAGFEIYQPGVFFPAAAPNAKPPIGFAGVYGQDVTDLNIHCNYIHGDAMPDDRQDVSFVSGFGGGILLTGYGMDSFNAEIWNNRVENVGGHGIYVQLYDTPYVDLMLARNSVTENAWDGLNVYAYNEEDWGSCLISVSGDYSNNGEDGVSLYTEGYDMAAALILDTTADNNMGNGISAQINANYLSGVLMASHVDLERVLSLVEGVLGGLPLGVGATEDGGLSDLLGLSDLYTDSGAMHANNNWGNGVYIYQNTEELALAGLLGVQANDNGQYIFLGKDGGGTGIQMYQYGGYGAVAALVRCEANDNDGPGMRVSSSGDDLALNVFVDVTANDNYNCGIRSSTYSQYGVAGAIVLSSDPLFGLVNVLLDELGGDVGTMDFSGIPAYGQVQANGNGGDGIYITANSQGPALAVVLDVNANGNGWAYQDNEGDGVAIEVTSWDSDAFALAGSSEALVDFVGELLGAEEAGVDLSGISQLGPMHLNDNEGNGLNLSVNGAYGAWTGVIGVEALRNGYGFNPEGAKQVSFPGAGIAMDVYSEWDEVMVGVADVVASENAGDGVAIYAYGGDGDASVGGVNIRAEGNGGRGVAVDANAPNDDVWVALAGIQANGNYESGVDVDVSAFDDAATAIAAIQANDNGDRGIRLIGSSSYGQVWMSAGPAAMQDMEDTFGSFGFFGSDYVDQLGGEGIEVSGNEETGLRMVGTSDGSIWVDVESVLAEDNNNAGVSIDLSAWGQINVAVSDVEATGNALNGVAVVAASDAGGITVGLDDVTATGNDRHGVRLVLDAYGLVDADITESDLSGNGEDGLHINLTSLTEIQLFGEGNAIRDNVDDGFDVNASAPSGHRYYDFGGGALGSLGQNSLTGNGTYDVNRSGVGPFYLMNNYWGGGDPVAGVDYIGNNMQVGGALPDPDPNP